MRIHEMRRRGFEALGRAEVGELLQASGSDQEALFEWARDVRREEGLDDVLMRGVIEVSNICHKSCDYCAMRAPNDRLGRYEMQPDEVIEIAWAVRRAGIGVVMLQAGQYLGHERLLEAVLPVIRRDVGIGVVLCMGERDPNTFAKYRTLGADSYILKYETSDSAMYRKMTRNDLERRVQNVAWARAAGLQVGTGNMVGLPGQSPESLVEDVFLGVRIAPDFISSSPFVPNANTPYEGCPSGNLDITLNTIALYRIALRTPLIPSVSALETLRPGGQKMGLNAGANVVTVNFTPREARSLYRIYSDRRFVVSLDHALSTVAHAGLEVLAGTDAERRAAVCSSRTSTEVESSEPCESQTRRAS